MQRTAKRYDDDGHGKHVRVETAAAAAAAACCCNGRESASPTNEQRDVESQRKEARGESTLAALRRLRTRSPIACFQPPTIKCMW